MKIVEDSPNRLVLKEGSLTSRIFGAVLMIAGLVGAGLAVAFRAKLHNSFIFDAIGIVVAAGGGFMLTSAQSDMVVADNTSKQLTVTFKSLKKRQGANQTYSFNDVQSVQLLQHYQQVVEASNNFNNGPGMSFGGGFGVGMGNTQTMLDQSLSVQLKNGSTVTIANEDKQTGLTLGISANSLVTKGQKLAAVMEVPFNQQGPSTPGQFLQGIERGIVGQPESFARPQAQVPDNKPAPTPTPAPTEPNDNSWQNPRQ